MKASLSSNPACHPTVWAQQHETFAASVQTSLISFAATALLSALFVRVLIWALTRADVLDHANERSSHTRPTPRGGGLGVMAAISFSAIVLALTDRIDSSLAIGAILCAGALACVCFIDDLRGLSARLRLLAQAAIVAVGLGLLAEIGGLPNPFPPGVADWLGPAFEPLRLLILGLAWMWFINLFNFMDGIDGLAGSQGAIIAGGAAAVAALSALQIDAGWPTVGFIYAQGLSAPEFAPLAAAIAGACVGFLIWNWPPARIFMGDVGAAPLGFLLGGLMLLLAAKSLGFVVLAAAAMFIVDATLTLTRRALRGEAVWRAHREHAYQRAARGFGAHRPATLWFAGVSATLGGGALLIFFQTLAGVKCDGPEPLTIGYWGGAALTGVAFLLAWGALRAMLRHSKADRL